MATQLIDVVNPDGARSRMTRKRFEAVQADGWREWTDEDRRAEKAERLAARNAPAPEAEIPTAPAPPEPRRRKTVDDPADVPPAPVADPNPDLEV